MKFSDTLLNIEKENHPKTIAVLNNVSVSKGMTEILKEVSLNIQEGEHIALVGPNGAGKTTFLNVLTGREDIDDGELILPSETKIAYVPQTVDTILKEIGDSTVYEYFLYSRDLLDVQVRMREIENLFERGDFTEEGLLEEYGELQEVFELKNGYDLEHRIEEVLAGINLPSSVTLETNISELSGGEKAKLFLAQVLISDANLLLLDEPSNHLDSESYLWLSLYLSKLDKAIIAISHDPDFLDVFVDRVLVLDPYESGIGDFKGSYTDYLEQKEILKTTQTREFIKKKKKIEKLEEEVNRFRAGVNSKKAKDREKKLSRTKEEFKERKTERKTFNLQFQIEKPSGQEVLHIKDLIKKFPDKTLDYSALDLKIYRGNRIAIQGPIGVGKSTLLKIIAGSLRPDSGEVNLGYRVDMGYYAQEMVDLNKSLSVIQEISKSSMGSSEQKLRDYLGVFMFRGDDVFKPVSVLSYGERSRLMIAKLALGGYNFLLLDEPTNHLDLEVKKSLRDMLYGYEGTILIVSHDEKFLKGIGLDKTILLPEGEALHN